MVVEDSCHFLLAGDGWTLRGMMAGLRSGGVGWLVKRFVVMEIEVGAFRDY